MTSTVSQPGDATGHDLRPKTARACSAGETSSVVKHAFRRIGIRMVSSDVINSFSDHFKSLMIVIVANRRPIVALTAKSTGPLFYVLDSAILSDIIIHRHPRRFGRLTLCGTAATS
jgi:hypothetical protein